MLGIAYCYLNKPELADKYFSASLSIFKQLFGDDSAYCATALTGLCVSSFLMGDISKSEAYGKRAISTFDVYPDVSHYRGKCQELYYSIYLSWVDLGGGGGGGGGVLGFANPPSPPPPPPPHK